MKVENVLDLLQFTKNWSEALNLLRETHPYIFNTTLKSKDRPHRIQIMTQDGINLNLRESAGDGLQM